MADLSQLETALRNADAAGDTSAAQMLAAEIQKQRSMSHGAPPAKAGVVDAMGAGFDSRLNKIADGINQVRFSGDDAVLRGMAQMQEDQKRKDAPIQERNPIAFGIGDSAPLLAVPGGQATVLGRVAAPALGAAAMEAISHGSLGERAGRAAVAGGLGAAGGFAGEGATALLMPRRGMQGLAPDVADAVSRNNFPLTASQRTGSQALLKLEDYLATAPGSINRMAGVRDQQQDVLNRLAARSIGQNADGIDQNVLSAARSQIGSDRSALQSAVQVSPVNPELMTGVRNARQSLAGMQAGPQSVMAGQVKQGASVIDDMEQFIATGSPMDGAAYQTWRTAIREAKETAYDNKNSKLGDVYDSLLKSLDKTAQSGRSGPWKLNDAQYSALKTIEKGNALNEATGNVNPRTLANNFMSRYGQSAKEGAIPGELKDIGLLAKGVPEYKPGSPTAGREAWRNLLYGGLGGLGLTTAAGANPALAGLVLGVPALNNLLARSVTGQGKGLATDSPILNAILREQLQRAAATGVQGTVRGTVAPGLAVPL